MALLVNVGEVDLTVARQIAEDVTHLRVDGAGGFAADGPRQAAEGAGVAPCHDDRVEPNLHFVTQRCGTDSKWLRHRPVQVSGEIPEAGLASEPSVDQDVESADAEQGRVSLSAWEDVEGRVIEADVADDVGRLQEMIQRHRRQNVGNIPDESVDGVLLALRLGGAQPTGRVDGYLPIATPPKKENK